jgi:hypothetical protein
MFVKELRESCNEIEYSRVVRAKNSECISDVTALCTYLAQQKNKLMKISVK